tara:strand:+ start:2759 stop:3181 length:423 start_codon:yes stop_codon:yes gene_type:complete
MDLTITSKLVIPSNELQWRFSRSSGAGGQNVNKTDSRVEIVFDIKNSKVLTPLQKLVINRQLQAKLIRGCICIAVQEKRTQYQNRQLALTKLASILKEGLKPAAKTRIRTRPTQASQKRRLDSKKKHGETKKNRHFKIEE